jgi:II/X family phage/plasmid replication protein
LVDAGDLENLQKVVNETLRWETSIKARKLDEEFGENPRVEDIGVEWIHRLHYREVGRLVREGKSKVKTVRKQKQVRDRLFDVYPRSAGLFDMWMQLFALGERFTRQHMTRATFYRHHKQLVDGGVSWIGSDVLYVPKASSLPQDFSPTRTDPRRVVGEHATVSAKLSSIRAA